MIKGYLEKWLIVAPRLLKPFSIQFSSKVWTREMLTVVAQVNTQVNTFTLENVAPNRAVVRGGCFHAHSQK
jgi:hypothetical protein